jgi:hypothetical protein
MAKKGTLEKLGRAIDKTVADAAPKVEAEFKKMMKYLNDDVVPKLHKESATGMKRAAAQLRRMADKLEKGAKR